MEIKIGTKYTSCTTVDESNTASAVGSGLVDVFATPMMIAQMELAASECIKPFLNEGQASVGTMVNVTHTSATPVGMKVYATAEVIEAEGRRVEFKVAMRDEAGEIGGGTHTRFIVDVKKFMEKAESKNKMRILAIETSCDETAAAVVENGRRVLSSVVASQIEAHAKFGGVVPEIASRQHTENISDVVCAALEQSGYELREMDAIAVTAAPGLIGALLVGVSFAKGLSLAAKKPLIPVHHIRGHVASNYIAHPNFEPPFLCLVVSGGHTHIVEVKGYTEYRVLGRTRDDAAGEAFDKAARVLGLPYPGGVHIDKAAAGGNPEAYILPRPKLDTPYDFSFSGLKTAVINIAHNLEQKGEKINTADMAACFRRAVCEILTDKFFSAARDYGYKRLACAGGVCANALLREMLEARAKAENIELYLPPPALCGDNAAMIGAQGYYEYIAGHTADLSLNASAGMDIENHF